MGLLNRIKTILKEKPYCIDNDDSLCFEIWNQDCSKLNYNLGNMTAIELLNLISTNKISKKQTILRRRRSLNREFPKKK